MARKKTLAYKEAAGHFVKRAQKYNSSSQWVDDAGLIGKIRNLVNVGHEARVLDIAIGTGKIAQAFYGQVKYVVGVDICKDMVCQARRCADQIVLALAERLPFKNNTFDVCVCRQGLQFMDIKAVLSEIFRVLKFGGHALSCHLTAYAEEDQNETFYIQRLRNPARKNFFLPGDIQRLMREHNFSGIDYFEYITRESVNQWINNAAIDGTQRMKIREAYINSSELFRKLHAIEFKNGDIFDSMKMVIVKAKKSNGG